MKNDICIELIFKTITKIKQNFLLTFVALKITQYHLIICFIELLTIFYFYEKWDYLEVTEKICTLCNQSYLKKNKTRNAHSLSHIENCRMYYRRDAINQLKILGHESKENQLKDVSNKIESKLDEKIPDSICFSIAIIVVDKNNNKAYNQWEL